MKTVTALSFLLLLSCCKSPLEFPPPPKKPDTADLRTVTFSVYDVTEATAPFRNHMKLEIADWDSIVELPPGRTDFVKKWKLRKSNVLGDWDTVRFYYYWQNGNQPVGNISETKISVERNQSVEWKRSSNPNQPLPDTLKTTLIN